MARRWAMDLWPLIAEHRPDLLNHDVGTLGAALAGAVAGVPALGHGFGRWFPSSMSEPMTVAYATLAAESGVADVDQLVRGRVLDICPESIQAKEFLALNRVPLRPVGWCEPGMVVPSGSGRPRVYLTLGTAFTSVEVLRRAIDGLMALPVDVWVTAGRAVDTTALRRTVADCPGPGTLLIRKWLPQAALLPHVDLVVHHGGAGTMLGALTAGVPQLLLPQGADQFANADAVVQAGAGARLLPGECSPEAVTTAAGSLLFDKAVHAAARCLAHEVAAMPSPEDIVAMLPKLVSESS
jgi:UDP:flavonoid glycosyltransferase YjiC (YdhE family)